MTSDGQLLPKPIHLIMIANLDIKSLARSFQVCVDWSSYSNENAWKRCLERHHETVAPHKPDGMTWKELAHALSIPETSMHLHYTGLVLIMWGGGGGFWTFVGHVVDKLPHGLGILIGDDHVYSGEVKSDKILIAVKQGEGCMKWKNGNVYKGSWVNNHQQGRGTYEWADGERYTGEFHNNYQHGKGVYTWPDGTSYTGDFAMNSFHGEGTYVFQDAVYTGSWRRGVWHGHGVLTWADGTTHEGHFVDNHRSGKGVATWTNGIRFEGQHVDNLRHGPGVLYWSNGDRYEGHWLNGGRNGIGYFFDIATGEKIEQYWKEKTNIQYLVEAPKKYMLKRE